MATKVDVGEFVMITKKNDEFFGKIGIVSDQDGDIWFVTFPRHSELLRHSGCPSIQP